MFAICWFVFANIHRKWWKDQTGLGLIWPVRSITWKMKSQVFTAASLLHCERIVNTNASSYASLISHVFQVWVLLWPVFYFRSTTDMEKFLPSKLAKVSPLACLASYLNTVKRDLKVTLSPPCVGLLRFVYITSTKEHSIDMYKGTAHF